MKNQGDVKRRGKAGIIAVAAVLIAAGTGAVFYMSTNTYAADEEQTEYREYSVSKGNITVGISESGTASLGRSYASFPVSAEIEEVYVKVGTKVSAGDKLAKLNTDDVDEVMSKYESEISSAKLELDTAVSEKETNLAEAKKAYETSVNGGETADEVYSLSITKIQSEISDAEKNIESLKKQLSEYEELLASYPADYEKYTEYETKYQEYSDTYEQYSDVYSGYEKVLKSYNKELDDLNDKYNEYLDSISEDSETIKELKAAVESTKAAYDSAVEKYNDAVEDAEEASYAALASSDSDTDTSQAQSALKSAQKEMNSAYEAYAEAQRNYSDKYVSLDKTYSDAIERYEDKVEAQQDKISEYQDMMDEYADMMSDYKKEMDKYKTEYDEYKEDFGEDYGTLDEDGIEDKIESLKAEIENAEYNLEDLQVNESSSELSAYQKKQDTVLAAGNAETVYNQTVEKINRNISDLQDQYDTLCDEYNELVENMGDGVYLYADCDGQVASVNISEGDTIMADQNVITLTDLSEIYVSVAVSESDISSLTVGQETSIVFSSYENVTMSGEIDTIAVEPARSSGSVTYTVTVKVDPDDKYDIREGMTAEVTFLQKQVTNVFYTNINAVNFRDGISYVLVYDESGNVVEQQVTTGFTDGRYVEISGDISAGDKVLAEIALSGSK